MWMKDGNKGITKKEKKRGICLSALGSGPVQLADAGFHKSVGQPSETHIKL